MKLLKIEDVYNISIKGLFYGGDDGVKCSGVMSAFAVA